MPLDNSQSPQIEGCKRQETLSSHSPEEDEEEEEDVDFNPFMKETSSPEASSSLSSDDEGLGADAVHSWRSPSARKKTSLALDSVATIQECTIHNEEEVLTPKADSLEEERGKESKSDVTRRPKRRKLVSNSEDWYSSKEIAATEMNTASSGNDVVEDTSGGVSTNPIHSTDDLMEVDDEDAICKRTRARYSLANFSLDELETFLQETDDEEDLHNVDDEQEYRKFLTAVLQGGENEDQSIQEDESVYDEDEDEDSDVDFEIELEEALDSDHDESIQGKKNGGRGVGCRPKTRQNNHNEKRFLVQANRPLRPLVPRVANTQVPPFSSILHFPPSSQAGLPVGFTPHQIGQLHCLIHEHTQLLVQVFSLSVLDPSRQQIASETRQLISELVSKREKVLSWRKVPYPDYCFRPPCIHSSVSDGPPKIYPSLLSVDASSSGQKEALGMIPISHSSFPFRTRVNNGGLDDSLQTTKDSLWLPRVSGPILSILDVVPLRIVGSYMDEVSRATQECKRRHVEGTFDTRIERIPLFPVNISLTPEANEKASKVATSQSPNTVSSPSKVHQSPKKTLAATLVESTKKQSIAFVPKEIVTLAQRFYPLFNAELYPHKPPPVTVANRVLFTDREDELLAMGLMEYNTDWKAIQQRFLPCKSKHQIFVRQKNRCSSKAPENPIKAVRRMKTSPLTAEEKVHIHKGLKAFKHDWMSVWKFIVPYRDPSLLPRQWRVALGTQKSYKTDTAKKEKRRLYLAQKKLGKAAPLVNLPTASEKEDIMHMNNSTAEGNKSEDDNMENEDEAYVHEAFLADWRPRNSRPASSELAHARLDGKNVQPGNALPQEHFCASGIPTGDWNGGYQPEHIYTRDFFHSNSPHDLHNVSHFTHVKYSASYTVASNHFSPNYLSKPSQSQVVLRPRQVRKKKDAQSVKLAPGLPPVNLPPSVRVVSQSAFKSYHCVTSHSTKISTSGVETENLLPSSAHVVKSGMAPSMNAGNRGSTQSSHRMTINCSQEQRIDSDDNSADTGLQLHPLLLQSPEDGQLSHCPVNTSTCMSNTLNFMERNHHQANFGHICKPTHAGSTVDGFYTTLSSMDSSKSCGIDFHPLLQRRDVSFTQLLNSSDPVMSEPPPVTNVPQATAPIPASPSEDAEELDLEIHLSSTSRKKKVSTERKVIEQGYNGSRGLLNFGILKETDKSNNNSSERVESFPVASLAGSSSYDNALVLSNNSSFTENCVGDQSHPEIVMEQEELSDSEEENGEDVEFECEEMDDSEREESDCG